MSVRGLWDDFSSSRAIGAALLALGLIAACSSTRESFAGGDDGKADAGDEFDPANSDGTCTECSADLHSVVTCGDNPKVLKTCPDDQACGSKGCVPACEGAAANKSSIGCDYYAVEPDAWSEALYDGAAPGSCFAAFITNNWNADMKVTLVWKGKTIDATPFAFIPRGTGSAIKYEPIPEDGIPPNGMAIVFLNQWAPGAGELKVTCPKAAAIEDEDIVTHGTGLGKALEIKTSVPGVVYDVYPFGGAKSYISSATLLLPTSVWDTNYVTTTMSTVGSLSSYPGGIDFVAQEDETEVTLLPAADIPAGGGLKPAAKNKPIVYKIGKGEMLHLQSSSDLTGSIVQSNKPVGVWGEHYCMTQPNPPKWRIVGAVDDTELTFEPAVSTAPKKLAKGQLVEFDGPGAFHVTSQDEEHPFYLAAHRPGDDCDAAHQQIPPVKALGNDYVAVGNEATDYGVGGPETVNVVPPAQFLPSYTFFSDPTYGYTELALTRKKGTDGEFKEVTLDCLGEVSGWKPVGDSDYEFAHVRLRHGSLAQGKCDNGRHEIKSDVPFGITVWGYDSASSYAYPAGASVRPINQVVVPPSVK